MVTNNEAVDNFLSGKRNLAAYQFSQLIKETAVQRSHPAPADSPHQKQSCSPPFNQVSSTSQRISEFDPSSLSSSTPSPTTNLLTDILNSPSSTTSNSNNFNNSQTVNSQRLQPNCDEIAFNYGMVNLFTNCPQRASIIFSDLVKRYSRNPRLWLRLAESMLATERAKLTEFEHIQQISNPHARNHVLKTKNRPILIKINPNYCQQQIEQQLQSQRGTPPNFLVTIKSYLLKSLELINEYNDISLLSDDLPNHLDTTSTLSITSSSMLTGPSTTSNSLYGSKLLSKIHNLDNRISQHLSFANPYQCISRSDLYLLKIKVQLNLAYVFLCMGEPNEALIYSTLCLKSSPKGYEKVLAHLYHAEACILTGRTEEAIQFLNLEILNMSKSLAVEHPVVTKENSKVIYAEEMQRQLENGSLTTVVTYNLAVAYASRGEFSNSHKVLMQSVQPNQPHPMEIIICLLYIQLQQGQLESAKRMILNNLPQFR